MRSSVIRIVTVLMCVWLGAAARSDGESEQPRPADRKKAELLYETGLAAEKEKAFETAIASYRNALSLFPDTPDVEFRLALCFQHQDRDEEAATWFKAALKHGLQNPEAAVAKAELDRINFPVMTVSDHAAFKEAVDLFEAARSVRAADPAAAQQLLMDVVTRLEKLQASAVKYPPINRQLGYCHADRGNYLAAATALKAYLDRYEQAGYEPVDFHEVRKRFYSCRALAQSHSAKECERALAAEDFETADNVYRSVLFLGSTPLLKEISVKLISALRVRLEAMGGGISFEGEQLSSTWEFFRALESYRVHPEQLDSSSIRRYRLLSALENETIRQYPLLHKMDKNLVIIYCHPGNNGEIADGDTKKMPAQSGRVRIAFEDDDKADEATKLLTRLIELHQREQPPASSPIQLQRTINLDGKLSAKVSVAHSADGHQLSIGKASSLRMIDLDSGTERFERKTGFQLESVAFSPETRRIACGGGNQIQVYDGDGDLVYGIDEQRQVGQLHFSPDGKRLVSATGVAVLTPSKSMSGLMEVKRQSPSRETLLSFRDPATGEAVKTEYRMFGTAFAFAPGGRQLVTLGLAITLRDAITGEALRTLDQGGATFHQLAFCPSGQFLAAGNVNGDIRMWNLASGQPVRDLRADSNALMGVGVAYSPDGKHIATWKQFGDSFKLWNTENGRLLVEREHDVAIDVVDFNPDGKRLVSAGGNVVKIWDVKF